MKKKWYKNPLIYVLLIIFLGLSGIIRIFQVYPNIATTYIAIFTIILAIATVFLAYFTYFSIKSSNDREKRRLEENERIRKEERDFDFKRRCLNDIQDWALMGYKNFYGSNFETLESGKFQETLTILYAKKNGMVTLSQNINGDFLELVKSVAKFLERYWFENSKWNQDEKLTNAINIEKLFAALINGVASKKAELKT